MEDMEFGRLSRMAALAALIAVVSTGLLGQTRHFRGRKYKAPPPVSRVDVTIVRADDSTPVENASVIFQLVGDKGNMELKTDRDGKTYIDVLPTGSKFLLQVLAKGYQTFGQTYDLEKKSLAIEVKLNRPGQQYSIYDKHATNTRVGGTAIVKSDKSSDAEEKGKSPEPTQDTAKKPDTSQPQQ